MICSLNQWRHIRTMYFWPKCSMPTLKFTQTINLPQSNFPMKHQRNLELQVEKQNIKFEDLFLTKSEGKETFILHDGPPYANGDAHFGHAINRCLKDIIIKRKLLENYNVHYRPGWDCHGLPIELKAIPDSKNFSALEIRSKARQFAFDAIDRQRRAFEQWFISADWSRSYRTFDIEYSLQEIKAFYSLYKKGLIFRDLMPVFWSPSTQTALAEAELQYKTDHISRSAFICYPVINSDKSHFNALIWTTTPWTLLANEAIAYSERLNYCLIRIVNSSNENLLLVAKENIPLLQEKFAGQEIRIEYEQIEGLENFRYQDLINGEIKPFLPSVYITSTKGTGLVHIAPNHGYDDFKLIKAYYKEIPSKESIVDDQGRVRLPDGQRVSILDNSASRFVLEKLLPPEYVLLVEDYQHSYPYDWRSGHPVIICPSHQWFLNIDSIRAECIEALQKIRFYPEILKKEMINQIMMRPNWCLSRQRKYGVPIPIFYNRETNQPIINDQIFETLLNKFRSKGLDIWWQEEPVELLSKCPTINAKSLIKSQDIFDIWFDSGCSWLAVLPEPEKISEIYLEGIDQIRGWFQSSLIISVALRGRAPYRSIFIHGFALDHEGHKMSKSLGNVVDPMDIVNGKFTKSSKNGDCGLDGLRFWVARYASTHSDVHVDLKKFNEEVLIIINKFRNNYRFLLGYLTRYSSKSDSSFIKPEHYQQMRLLDKYLLYRILKFNLSAQQFYDEYCFSHLMESLIFHFNYEISTFYFTRIKDRLYCDSPESNNVRSILTIFYHCYHTVSFYMAPILPHLIMECHQNLPMKREGILSNYESDRFVQELLFSRNSSITEDKFCKMFKVIYSIINSMNEWAGTRYQLIHFDCHLFIPKSNKNYTEILNILQFFQPSPNPQIQSDLAECLQTAQVSYGDELIEIDDFTECLEVNPDFETKTIEESSPEKNDSNTSLIRILLRQTLNKKCSRCRRFTITNQQAENNSLCNRCSDIINGI